MGNKLAKLPKNYEYMVAAGRPSAKSTSIFRSATHPDELIENLLDVDIRTPWDLFTRSVQQHGKRPFLGRRFPTKSNPDVLGPYVWISYSEACTMALEFGTALVRENFISTSEFPDKYEGAQKMKILGLYSKNCVEWLLAEQACNAYGITMCPLYDTLGEEAMAFILKQTRLECCICSYDCLPTLLKVLQRGTSTKRLSRAHSNKTTTPKPVLIETSTDADTDKEKQNVETSSSSVNSNFALKTVILVDPPIAESISKLREKLKGIQEQWKATAGVRVFTWHDIMAKGKPTLLPTPSSRNEVATLCYTSGTTGLPKGVLLTNRQICACVCSGTRGPISTQGVLNVSASDVIISYLPLAHVYERAVNNIVLSVGGAIGVYSGDLTKLLEDIRILKPTVFVSVPRLFNRINDRISLTLMDKKMPTQILFSQGLNSKLRRRRSNALTHHKLWDTVVFNKIKELLGGRVRCMICGGAPIDSLVLERMQVYFSAPLIQGYGLTESFGQCFLMHPLHNSAGPIGGIWPAVEMKLVSVPELDYYVTDKPPKGELCLRGPGITVGYFLNDDENEKSFDKDAWFHTGDVCEILENEYNAVQIIDRKKNIFKLSQGEYVAPEKIEGVYSLAMLVGQIFVFGYSAKTFLVAIVVPDADAAAKWAQRTNAPNEMTQLCKSSDFSKAVMQEMNQVATKNGIKGFEKVKAIHLSAEPFTVENGMLTPTQKLKRHIIKKNYNHVIDSLYSNFE